MYTTKACTRGDTVLLNRQWIKFDKVTQNSELSYIKQILWKKNLKISKATIYSQIPRELHMKIEQVKKKKKC